jgi:hypothetical protein
MMKGLSILGVENIGFKKTGPLFAISLVIRSEHKRMPLQIRSGRTLCIVNKHDKE